MTLNDLIVRLEEYKEVIGGETEVRLMTQYNWPFECTLAGVCSGLDINDHEGSEEDACVDDDKVVYLVEGKQIGYGSRVAWHVL